jgi:hypothetical protein
MSEFDCLIGAIENVTKVKPDTIRKILVEAERLGWLRNPSRSGNIPMSACGSEDLRLKHFKLGK